MRPTRPAAAARPAGSFDPHRRRGIVRTYHAFAPTTIFHGDIAVRKKWIASQ